MNVIGVDWGSSNRRAYWLDGQGRLLDTREDDCGLLKTVAQPGGFPAALQALIGPWRAQGPARVWLSGMVGSRSGWHEAPYLPLPCRLSDLAAAARPVPGQADVFILPGLCQRSGLQDVMRGEETQLLGALALCPQDGWFLLPGTHSKWVQVAQGAVRRFHTVMSGELFELLRWQGSLAAVAGGRPPIPSPQTEAAFDQGCAWARQGDSLAQLFRLRAQALLEAPQSSECVAARLSGLLIAAELRSAAGWLRDTQQAEDQAIPMIAASGLAHWYGRAARLAGLRLQALAPQDCQLAALRQLEAQHQPERSDAA